MSFSNTQEVSDDIDDLEMITRRGTHLPYALLSLLTFAHKQDDDPFFSEVSNFIDAIEGGPEPHILSSFEDATKTYEYVLFPSLQLEC